MPLPDVKQVGDRSMLEQLEPTQHFTKPPPRFGEASLVKELEKRGIGRPSTYASIISTIQDRGYVRLENRRFHAEKMGEIVTERLVENFDDLMDYGFTAGLEEALDEVAVGIARSGSEVLGDFYDGLPQEVDSRPRTRRRDALELDPTDTDIPCPKCGRPMQIRTASTGVFLGCSGYCAAAQGTLQEHDQPHPGEEAIDRGRGRGRRRGRSPAAAQEAPLSAAANTSMDSYLVDETRKLHVCGDNPDCPGFEVETRRSFQIKGYDGPVLECDKCGEDMQLKSGRFGKYFRLYGGGVQEHAQAAAQR